MKGGQLMHQFPGGEASFVQLFKDSWRGALLAPLTMIVLCFTVVYSATLNCTLFFKKFPQLATRILGIADGFSLVGKVIIIYI
jgi:hypothetical protein